jgi:hypothetical protein
MFDFVSVLPLVVSRAIISRRYKGKIILDKAKIGGNLPDFQRLADKKRAKPCAEHRATVAKIPAITRVIRSVAGAKT